MNWQAPGDFLRNGYFRCSTYKGNITFWGYFVESPETFTDLISVFRYRDAANILIDYTIVTEYRIQLKSIRWLMFVWSRCDQTLD